MAVGRYGFGRRRRTPPRGNPERAVPPRTRLRCREASRPRSVSPFHGFLAPVPARRKSRSPAMALSPRSFGRGKAALEGTMRRGGTDRRRRTLVGFFQHLVQHGFGLLLGRVEGEREF